MGGKARFCLNGKRKGRVPQGLLSPLQGQDCAGLSLGHGGQFCGNPLFKASIYSGKRLSSGRARPKQPHLTSHLKVRLFSFPGCLDWFCCLPILQPPLLTSLGPGVGKNYPLPEKASLKPFPSFFFLERYWFFPLRCCSTGAPSAVVPGAP